MIDRLRQTLSPRPDPAALAETLIAQQSHLVELLETALAGQAALAAELADIRTTQERLLGQGDQTHTLVQRAWGSERRREVFTRAQQAEYPASGPHESELPS